MVAITTPGRQTRQTLGNIFKLPVEAATLIYGGALVCLNAAGNATKGITATTLKQFGRAETTVDNTAGIAGAKSVDVAIGIFLWANSAAGDLIATTEVGTDCYIVDDQTVAKTNGGATRSRAGKVIFVDATGVYVQMGPQF